MSFPPLVGPEICPVRDRSGQVERPTGKLHSQYWVTSPEEHLVYALSGPVEPKPPKGALHGTGTPEPDEVRPIHSPPPNGFPGKRADRGSVPWCHQEVCEIYPTILPFPVEPPQSSECASSSPAVLGENKLVPAIGAILIFPTQGGRVPGGGYSHTPFQAAKEFSQNPIP